MLALSLLATAVIMTTIYFQRDGSSLQSAIDPLVREQVKGRVLRTVTTRIVHQLGHMWSCTHRG